MEFEKFRNRKKGKFWDDGTEDYGSAKKKRDRWKQEKRKKRDQREFREAPDKEENQEDEEQSY